MKRLSLITSISLTLMILFSVCAHSEEYVPANKSDIFFFGFIDLYYLGYRIPLDRIHDSLRLDIYLGGGWAPVSHEVKVDGHINEGDFYPLADIKVSYAW